MWTYTQIIWLICLHVGWRHCWGTEMEIPVMRIMKDSCWPFVDGTGPVRCREEESGK